MRGVAVRIMAFPFRVDGTGSVVTVEQGSDTEIEQQIGLAMTTRPGERITVPTFGVADPAFTGFEAGALQRHLDDFGPDVEITTVLVDHTTEGREQVVIDWRRRDRAGRTQ
jgi:hypothetical protein